MGKRRGRAELMVAERLELFIEQAGRLANRRLVQAGFDTSLTITAGGGPPSVSWARPDQEEFHAFLVDLRPFISDQEPVFLNRVYNLIQCYVTDPKLRYEARKSRERLRAAESGAAFRQADRTPAQIADAYIDGTFHVDPDARRRMARPEGFFADLDRWFVQSYCARVSLQVAEVAAIARQALASGVVVETPFTANDAAEELGGL